MALGRGFPSLGPPSTGRHWGKQLPLREGGPGVHLPGWLGWLGWLLPRLRFCWLGLVWLDLAWLGLDLAWLDSRMHKHFVTAC